VAHTAHQFQLIPPWRFLRAWAEREAQWGACKAKLERIAETRERQLQAMAEAATVPSEPTEEEGGLLAAPLPESCPICLQVD
jgi:hypothetical protein